MEGDKPYSQEPGEINHKVHTAFGVEFVQTLAAEREGHQ